MRLLIIIILISNFTFAQYWGGQEIDASNLKPWIPKSESEYAGLYHFGESEGESDFTLFFSGDTIVAQVTSGYWEEDNGTWKTEYITLTNITIGKKGEFTSDQHSGQFITFNTASGEAIYGLKIDDPWSVWIEGSKFEIGNRLNFNIEDNFYGNYSKASFRKLTTDELKQMNSKDLKLMRNEIFARYGYIFKKGGAMDTYFRQQKWYKAENKNVDEFLTAIEKFNIALIKEFE